MRLPRRARRPVLAALAVLAAVLVGLALRGLGGPKTSAASIEVETVAARDIALTIEATGTVEPVNLVEVKSKASGQIVRMPVQVGSNVRAGDLLAQIDTRDVRNQYNQALASLRAAQAKVDISRKQKQRSDDLFAQQVITAGEHESATLDFANAQSDVVRARTDLDLAKQRLEDATVKAPINGTVLEQLVSSGQVISSATSSASGGTTLLKMADLGRIRLRALVSESDIGNVRPGQVANVTVDAFPQRPFQGTVEKVEPQAVIQQSVTMFPVLISISNEAGLLLPGMNGEVSMMIERRANVVAVPLDAVRSVREVQAVATALGLDARSVQKEVQRQTETVRSSRRSGSDSTRAAGSLREGRSGSGARDDGRRAWAAGRDSSRAGWRGRRSGGRDTGTGRGGRAQIVFVKKGNELEPRLVRLGLSDFDYAEVLSGVTIGEEVALLSIAEARAQRQENQSRIRQRLSGSTPGVPGGGGGGGGGRGGGGGGGGGR